MDCRAQGHGLRRCLLSVGFFLGRASFSDPKKGESRTVEATDKNLKKRQSGGLEQDHNFFFMDFLVAFGKPGSFSMNFCACKTLPTILASYENVHHNTFCWCFFLSGSQ